MSITDKHELDRLVRRLSPIDDDTVQAALSEDLELFAHAVMETPRHVELTDAAGTTAARSHTLRHGFIPAVAAVAIIVFAAATFTFLPWGTSQPAIAGWGPEPSEPTPALLDAAATECPPPLDAEPGEQLFSFMAADPTIVGIDMRGNAAAAVFADDTQYYLCNLVEEDGVWAFLSGLHGTASGEAGPIDADAAHQWMYGEMTLTTVVGFVDEPVERVSVELANGTQLDASVGDGMFIAWWPSQSEFTRASAYDATGTVIGTDDALYRSGFESVFED